MTRRLGHALVLVALLAAIGGHWVVLQSVAWTTMMAGNLRTASLSQAFERTFDGKHPCQLCKQITQGKQTEKKTEFRVEWQKFEFPYSQDRFVFVPPAHFWTTTSLELTFTPLPHGPPVPPPRHLAA